MAYTHLTIENHLAILTLARPDKRNAMNGEFVDELIHQLHQISENQAARVLLLAGEGDHFCAGADIHWMQTIAQADYETNLRDAKALANLMFNLYHFPKPTIAIAQGATMGGGLGLLATCDIAIVSEDAYFAFSEVKLGLVPAVISPYILSAIGDRHARYYFLTGERFDAMTAEKIGLVHEVTPLSLLNKKGREIADVLLNNAPSSLLGVKKLLSQIKCMEISASLTDETARILATLRQSDEAQKLLTQFQKK